MVIKNGEAFKKLKKKKIRRRILFGLGLAAIAVGAGYFGYRYATNKATNNVANRLKQDFHFTCEFQPNDAWDMYSLEVKTDGYTDYSLAEEYEKYVAFCGSEKWEDGYRKADFNGLAKSWVNGEFSKNKQFPIG